MINNRKKGFTLVELLAVIVILAIILVIAVPQIMNTIKDTTKASLESSVKMVASQVEKQYTVAQTLSKEFGKSGSCMQDWAGLNSTDYESCTYEIDEDGNAKVTIVGKGKFNGLNVCSGTKTNAEAIEDECSNVSNVQATPEQCFTFDNSTGTITDYDETCGTDVVIPQTIGGVQVLIIGFESLGSKEITSVVFPNSLKKIEEGAFVGNDIARVELPSSVTSIGNRAFAHNPLTYVYLENTSPEYIGCQTFGNNDSFEHNLNGVYDFASECA